MTKEKGIEAKSSLQLQLELNVAEAQLAFDKAKHQLEENLYRLQTYNLGGEIVDLKRALHERGDALGKINEFRKRNEDLREDANKLREEVAKMQGGEPYWKKSGIYIIPGETDNKFLTGDYPLYYVHPDMPGTDGIIGMIERDNQGRFVARFRGQPPSWGNQFKELYEAKNYIENGHKEALGLK